MPHKQCQLGIALGYDFQATIPTQLAITQVATQATIYHQPQKGKQESHPRRLQSIPIRKI
jgi:hypothetical protein